MKTEFVHEILQSCEKLNHMGNSQKKCFIFLCVHLCAHSKTQHTQWQQRSSRTTTKDLWKWSQAFSWGWKRLYFAPTCILSVASAFGFHTNINIYTPRYTDTKTHRSKNNHHITDSHKEQYLSERRVWSKWSIDIRRLEATQGNRLQPAIATLHASLLPPPKNEQRHSVFTVPTALWI